MMTSTRRILLFFTILAVIASATALTPDEAEAGNSIIVTAAVKGGGASMSIDNAVVGEGEEPAWGWGGGAQFFAGFKFAPTFALGLNADIMYYVHENEQLTQQNADGTRTPYVNLLPETSVFAPSVGVTARARFTNEWAAHISANYLFGSGNHEPTPWVNNQEGSFDLEGFQINLQAFYQFRINPYKTWVEFGPYLTYGFTTYSIETAVTGGTVDGNREVVTRERDSSHFTGGLALQVAFEIGI